jgi:hypothetical protein
MEPASAVILIGLVRLVIPFSLLMLVGTWVERHRRRTV